MIPHGAHNNLGGTPPRSSKRSSHAVFRDVAAMQKHVARRDGDLLLGLVRVGNHHEPHAVGGPRRQIRLRQQLRGRPADVPGEESRGLRCPDCPR